MQVYSQSARHTLSENIAPLQVVYVYLLSFLPRMCTQHGSLAPHSLECLSITLWHAQIFDDDSVCMISNWLVLQCSGNYIIEL